MPLFRRSAFLGQSVTRSSADCILSENRLVGRTPDMEGVVKGVPACDWWMGSTGRGRGQDVTTVITLIFAGQLRRCRMTVSRHQGVLHTSGVGRNHKKFVEGSWQTLPAPTATGAVHRQVHAAAGTSWMSWPAAQLNPASSRATAVSALRAPIRELRCR